MKKLSIILIVGLICCLLSYAACAQQKETVTLLETDVQLLSVGDVVDFGSYKQDTNEQTPIQWIVADKTENTVLLVSKKCLDVQKYWRFTVCSWEDSILRTWLNDTFYQQAFTPEEQRVICLTEVEGNRDYVFCLSQSEAETYLAPLNAMAAIPTYYAVNKGALLNNVCWWWTRTEGKTPEKRIAINENGDASGKDGSLNYISVRPALYVTTRKHADQVSLDGVWMGDESEQRQVRLSIRGDQFFYEMSDGTGATLGTLTFEGSRLTLYPADENSTSAIFSYDIATDALYHEDMHMSRVPDAENRMDVIGCDGDWYYERLPDGTAKVLMYTGSQNMLLLPNILDGIPVSVLGYGIFAWNQDIISIELPNTLHTIEDMAFYKCTELLSVTLPRGLTAIGKFAFAECTNLMDVDLPDALTTLGEYAFYATRIISVSLPPTLNAIGDYAFASCSSLRTVQFTEGLKRIGNSAFSYTGIMDVMLPESLQSIGNEAFSNCKELVIVLLPDGLQMLGNDAFASCNQIGVVLAPDGLDVTNAFPRNVIQQIEEDRKIAASTPIPTPAPTPSPTPALPSSPYTCYVQENGTICVTGYTGQESTLVVPAVIHGYPVEKIGEGAFQDSHIEKIVLPEGLIHIGKEAFYNCLALKTAELPSTLEYIDERAFAICESLEKINIPDGVTVIEAGTFIGCNALTSIALHDNIREIKDSAFTFSGLTTLEFPSGLVLIGEKAFQGTYLQHVILPDTLTFLGDHAFQNCSDLISIHIPDGITEIPAYCFTSCYDLETFNFPSALKRIGDHAFSSSIRGKELVLPDGLEHIGMGAFGSCTRLEQLTLPNSLLTIGEKAFSGAWDLKTVIIPAKTTLADNAFFECPKLVLDPSQNESVKDWAMRHNVACLGIEQVDIHEVLKHGTWISDVINYKGERGFIIFGDNAKSYVAYQGRMATGSLKKDSYDVNFITGGKYSVANNEISVSLENNRRETYTLMFDENGVPVAILHKGIQYDHIDMRIETTEFPTAE